MSGKMNFFSVIFLMLAILSFFCPPAFATSPEPLNLDILVKKVPQERSQLELDVSISAPHEALAGAKFIISSDDMTIVSVQPTAFDVPVLPAETKVIAFISLDQDVLYRISCFVSDSNNLYMAEKIFFARRVQGNAMQITEVLYDRFSQDDKARWARSQADARAKADLDELRANGLQIAIEKYPEGKTFPVLNNMGWDLSTFSWDQYDQALLDQAISNPDYHDLVKIYLEPNTHDPCPLYAAYYATLPPPQPICWNILVSVNIKVYLYSGANPTACGYEDWPGLPMKGEITFRNYVTSTCSSNCVLRTVTKPIDITLLSTHVNCGGEDKDLLVGYVSTTVGMAIGQLPVLSLKIFTSDTASGISAGRCVKTTINCDASSMSSPLWAPGTENVYVSQAGTSPSDLLYEHIISNTPPVKVWEVIATLKHTGLDASLHPEKIKMFGDMQLIKLFWNMYYPTLFPNDYTQYKACILDMDSWDSSFNYKCINPVMTVDDGNAAWGLPPYPVRLYHHTGHFLQYKMQNGQLLKVAESPNCAVMVSEEGAFTEGFAEWHQAFVLSGLYSGDPEGQEHSAWCNPDYCPEAYANPKKVWAFNAAFIENMFDKYNSDDINPEKCSPWPAPSLMAACSDERLDDAGNLIGWDNVHVSVSNLEQWIGHSNDNIDMLINNWTASGMPLYNEPNLCPLLTTHYFEDLCP
jgi:hypothetical protein